MKANLINYTIALLVMLLLSSLAVADQSQTVDQGGSDDVICFYTCSSSGFTATVKIGEIEDAIPGKSYDVPCSLYLESGYDVYEIMINIELDADLTYNSYSTSGTSWDDGTFDHSVNSGTHTFLLEDDSLSGNDAYNLLFTINCSVNTDVDFDTQLDITLPTDPDTPALDYGTSWCQASRNQGYIQTVDGEASFMLGTPTGYSYQAKDAANDSEKDTLIYIPIYFKANFPSDYLKIGFDFTEIDMYSDYDSFEAADGTNLTVYISALYGYIGDYSTTYEASDEWILLGNFLFEGHDYESNYSSSTSFDTTNVISYENLHGNCRVVCEGADANIAYDELDLTTGGIYYPEYTCETILRDADADTGGTVDVYCRVDHSFWAQDYNYRILVNDDVLSNAVAYETGTTHPDVEADHDYDGYWDIETTGSLTGKYILPGTRYIFKLTFDVDSNFLNDPFGETDIDFDCVENTDCWVKDFFHADGDKITRYCTDGAGYFDLTGCTITSPEPVLSVRDTIAWIDGSNYIAEIPIEINWVHADNEFDTLVFYVYPFWTYDSTTTYYDPNDITWKITPDGSLYKYMGLIGHPGSIDHADELLHVWVHTDTTGVYYGKSSIRNGYFADGNFTREFAYDEAYVSVPGAKSNDNGGNESLPYAYTLTNNYPNPFNATTNIEFSISRTEMVTLDIFDILGRKVNTLVNDEFTAGYHIVTWNGENAAGESVSTGYYFYKLTTPNFSQAKKMLLLK